MRHSVKIEKLETKKKQKQKEVNNHTEIFFFRMKNFKAKINLNFIIITLLFNSAFCDKLKCKLVHTVKGDLDV